MRWLVDGYNVIRRAPALAAREQESLQAGREALCRLLVAAARASGDQFTVVFDGNLFGPRDLLWGGDGSLFVSDTGNKKLLRFRPPQWQRETVLELPGPPVGLAWSAGLIAVAVPADGAVFLIDSARSEVVRRIELPCWEGGDQQEGYLALLPSGDLTTWEVTLRGNPVHLVPT